MGSQSRRLPPPNSTVNFTTSSSVLVCDTTVLLYLGRIQKAELLPSLFDRIYVPDAVLLELAAGKMTRADTIEPKALSWIVSCSVRSSDIHALPPNRLGPGERAAIACALAHPGCQVGLDDRQARLLAGQLGLKVIGTLGVLIKAKTAGLVPSVGTLLGQLQRMGFHLAPEVLAEALRLAGEK